MENKQKPKRIGKKFVKEQLKNNNKVLADTKRVTPDDVGFIRYLMGYSTALRELLGAHNGSK